jgi:hypothetical protein
VIPGANLRNAFGVKNSSFDTASLSPGQAIKAIPSSRQRRLKAIRSIVANATKSKIIHAFPALKRRAKIMPTLRLENSGQKAVAATLPV